MFNKLKEMLLSYKDILLKIEKIERDTEGQGAEIKVLFEYLKKLMETKKQGKIRPIAKELASKKTRYSGKG